MSSYVRENTTGWLAEGDDTVPEEWYGWNVSISEDWAFEQAAVWGGRVVSAAVVEPIMSIPPECAAYDAVVEIGSRVFGAKAAKLEELTIPESVRTIASDAFVGCTGLRFVYADPSNVEIVRTALEQSGLDLGKITVVGISWWTGESSFGNGLDVRGINSGDVGSELTIPSMIDGRPVVSVSMSVDSGVVSVKMPDSVVALGSYAFAWSEDLKQVTLGSGVRQIEDSAFNGAAVLETIDVSSENSAFRSEDGCVLSKDGTVLHKCPAGKTTLTLRAKLTEIAPGAFESAYPHIITRVEAGAAQIELIRTALDEAYYGDVEDIAFIVLEDVRPTIEGDEGATVTGDAETGFVIKPSEGKTVVEVTRDSTR